MSKFRIEKILNFFNRYLILGVIFILPLFFGYLALENNLFELPKMVLFRISVVLLVSIYFYQQFFLNSQENGVLILRRKEFIIPLVVSVFLFFHSIFFGINSVNSIYGLYDRQQGLISLIFYFLFFYLVVSTVRLGQIRSILMAIFASSLLVSFYGFFQWWGIDFVRWTEPASLTHRIFSSLGQPIFLGSFFILTIPISFYLFFTSKHWLGSVLYLSAIFIQCLALFLAYSLTAWLSLLVIVILTYGFLIFHLRANKNDDEVKLIKKRLFLFSYLIMLLAFGFLLHNWQKDWMLKDKLGMITNWREGSAQTRVILWHASWSAIKERPFFGYGLENQEGVLAKYYNQKWAEVETVNMLSNRAHNIFLDILLTAGILGLIIFLGILFYLLRVACKNYCRNNESLLSVFLGMAILAFVFSLQFSFLFVTAGVYLALYAGLLSVISNSQKINKGKIAEDQQTTKVAANNKLIVGLKVVIFLGIIGASSVLIRNNFYKLIADQYYRSILQASRDSDFYAQISLYDYIRAIGQTNSFYDQQFVSLMDDARTNPIYQKMQFTDVENRVNRIIKNSTHNYFSEKLTVARAYAILSAQDKSYYDSSKKIYQELIAYSPGLPMLYSEIADLCQRQKNYDEAQGYYQDFLNSLPALSSPLLNPDHRRAVAGERMRGLINLGDISVERKDLGVGGKYYVQAQAIDDKDPVPYYKIGRIFYLQHDFNRAIWYNKKASELDPDNYFYYYIIALMYKESGDRNEARVYVQRALKLNPNAPDALDLSWEL